MTIKKFIMLLNTIKWLWINKRKKYRFSFIKMLNKFNKSLLGVKKHLTLFLFITLV